MNIRIVISPSDPAQSPRIAELCPENSLLLSEAIQKTGAAFDMPCSGKGICGKCRVYASGALSSPTAAEREVLGEELNEGIRLACMTRAEGDCEIRLLAQKSAQIVTESAGALPREESYTPMGQNFGFAVDIGTTTVAVSLWDLREGGRELLQDAFPNPQSAYGADVISRIQAALDGKNEVLRQLITGRLDQSMGSLCKKAGLDAGLVDSVVITGNTTMLYLLTGTDTEPLSHSPFAIRQYFGETAEKSVLAFSSLPNAKILLPRTIAPFVGSDITCSILASGIRHEKGLHLMADIGTNGEMAISKDGRLFCCSTAAGPAFEGAGITMGSAAVEGALCRVDYLPPSGPGEAARLSWKSIGDQKPSGICGSGLIDAVAACLKAGLIDDTGRIDEDSPENAAFLTEYQNKPAVLLGDSGILLTQDDFRAVQLAKAAICAGLRSLIHEAGAETKQVENLVLAGGFGSFIRRESAAAIGLIPPELTERVRSIGNAALGGAVRMLLSGDARRESLALAETAENLELSTSPYFMDQYVEEMMFPLAE